MKPTVLADYLERVATMLRDRGDTAIDMAALLASRGYPGSTGSGSRSSDTTSSTERAGTTDPGQWAHVPAELAHDMRQLWYHATRVDGTMSRVLGHATTDDQTPAGTGLCYLHRLCEECCRPTLKDPDNRLRNGLGPACHQAWMRYRNAHPDATRQDFIDHRTVTLRAMRAVPG
jgi:hypothetical protein